MHGQKPNFKCTFLCAPSVQLYFIIEVALLGLGTLSIGLLSEITDLDSTTEPAILSMMTFSGDGEPETLSISDEPDTIIYNPSTSSGVIWDGEPPPIDLTDFGISVEPTETSNNAGLVRMFCRIFRCICP